MRRYDQWEEVLAPSSKDLKHIDNLKEGYYLVGTGDTGAAGALLCIGLIYFLIVIICSPILNPPPKLENSQSADIKLSLTTPAVMRTHQFWCLFIVFFSIASTGIGMISVSKSMFKE